MNPRFAAAAALALAALAAPAWADDARPAPRVIAPELFAPAYRDAPAAGSTPNPIPAPIAPKPSASPAPVAAEPPAPAVAAPPPTPVAGPPPVPMPDDAHPLGNCERGTHEWLACLDATSRLTDSAIGDAEQSLLQGLEHRAKLNPVMRAAVTKALRSADWDWRAMREYECGDLPLIERDLEGSIAEIRLICRIRRNRERVQELTERYGEAP